MAAGCDCARTLFNRRRRCARTRDDVDDVRRDRLPVSHCEQQLERSLNSLNFPGASRRFSRRSMSWRRRSPASSRHASAAAPGYAH